MLQLYKETYVSIYKTKAKQATNSLWNLEIATLIGGKKTRKIYTVNFDGSKI